MLENLVLLIDNNFYSYYKISPPPSIITLKNLEYLNFLGNLHNIRVPSGLNVDEINTPEFDLNL
jgi:hypothetical protein